MKGSAELVSGKAEALRWTGAALWLGTMAAEIGLPGDNPFIEEVVESTHGPMTATLPVFVWAWVHAQAPAGGELAIRRWLTGEILASVRGLRAIYRSDEGRRILMADRLRKGILPAAMATGAVCLLLGLTEGRGGFGPDGERAPGPYCRELMEAAYWRVLADADDRERGEMEALLDTVAEALEKIRPGEKTRPGIARAFVATHSVLGLVRLQALAVEGVWTLPMDVLVEMQRREP